MKRTFLILIAWLLAITSFPQYFTNLYGHDSPQGVLNNNRKSFLVTGYSTSNTPGGSSWPTLLKQMLDQHAGNDTTYYVFKHTVGGTPISKWTTICGDGSHIQDAIERYINPGTQIPAGVPIPAIMLAQQSLQWGFGDCVDRFTNIESPSDTGRINMGINAIQLYANAFLNAGINKVYMATHIYKKGNYTLNLYGERWALAKAISENQNLYAGPELFNITKRLFPEGFAADEVHPDIEVATMMAVYWYLALAGENANMAMAQQFADNAGIDLNDRADSKLVAYWTFNEQTGSIVYDSTENHHDGEIFSATRVAGKVGNALDFDGVDDFVSVENYINQAPSQICNLNKGTISCWINYEDIYNGTTIPEILPVFYCGQSSDSTAANCIKIYIGHNNLITQQRIYFTVLLNGKVELCFDNKVSLQSGQWYYYAVVIDSNDHRGYLNGVEFSKRYNAGTTIDDHGFFATVPAQYNDILRIGYGRFANRDFWHFNGSIDDFRIYGEALSASEIQDIYNQGSSGVVDNKSNTDRLLVYPNPTHGLLRIDLPEPANDFKITIYNQNGQLISKLKNAERIELTQHEVGIYFIVVETEDGVFRAKVVKL